nr:hypothetical protein [uncultured bacterium]VTZ55107.1 hypothetical protein [uncultured bacterium]VTZ55209.1 hypothetical protein [uncultured bacterium]VTZ55285.1 hypothetical protein [uncultured bacterium]
MGISSTLYPSARKVLKTVVSKKSIPNKDIRFIVKRVG